MNAYTELKEKQQAEVNAFPMFFAFAQQSFDEGMKRLGLEPTDTQKPSRKSLDRSSNMEIKITVERRRGSVTQGMVDVLINGEKVADFGDTIELIRPGEKYYGELIGGWASKTPDTAFIRGLLFHPYDEVYHISDKAKTALNKAEAQEIEGAAERPPRVEEIREKYGWPKKIRRDDYIGHICDVQPLADGNLTPIYRFPGGRKHRI